VISIFPLPLLFQWDFPYKMVGESLLAWRDKLPALQKGILLIKVAAGTVCLLISAGCSISPAPAVEKTAAQTQPYLPLVYFTSLPRYNQGIQPYEVPVEREFPRGSNLPEQVLVEFFAGPTEEEKALGLEAVTSGFSGFLQILVQNGVAHVYLEGTCASSGATYTIAQPLMANLLQFEEIRNVKIYDSSGETEQPQGAGNSIPFCLEP
jgi:hypothetical protein